VDPNKKTLIVFSGDLDKALAALVIANGAAAMGNEVTMFYTFWGLNIIRRPDKVQHPKSILQRAFGAMMPRGPERLQMSRMNVGGLGPVFMRKAMREANVDTLTQMLETAREQEIRMIACTMSMDVLGLTKEDLIDGIEFAGVATYFDYADDANVNLMI
jgi:peroxiredoxin family protein